MKELIIQAVVPVLATAISSLAGVVLLKVNKFIAVKTKNETVNAAMTRITETTKTIVDNITQTVASEYKDKSGGQLTNAQAINLKDRAFSAVFEQLPTSVLSEASEAVGPIGNIISAKIEQAILNQKK